MVAEITTLITPDEAGNEPVRDEVHGIWDADEAELFTRYRVSLKYTGRIMGGVPQKPEAIEGWILRSLQGGDAELYQAMQETLEQIGIESNADMTYEELKDAAKKVASKQHGNTFRRDANGLFIAAYQIKAAIKENVNILYAGKEKWGKTKKGPKSFVAERVFIDEDRVYLGRQEPDGVHLQVGHVTGPQGPRSTLTYFDYVEQPEITFTVSSLRDEVTPQQWKEIFIAMQRNAIGALRSMGYGQFRVTAFDKM